MNRLWLTTDTHFHHQAMIEYCGRPEDFDKRIFKGLQQVPHTDTLIHLGDVSVGDYEAVHGKWIQPLACRKVLIRGNHDRKSRTWYSEHGWDFVCDELMLEEYGKKILLSHVPKPDSGRFDLNIHGHFHNTDHRKHDPIYSSLLTHRHKLLALEYTNYYPVLLERMVWFSREEPSEKTDIL